MNTKRKDKEKGNEYKLEGNGKLTPTTSMSEEGEGKHSLQTVERLFPSTPL